jgi:hypothetical protein
MNYSKNTRKVAALGKSCRMILVLFVQVESWPGSFKSLQHRYIRCSQLGQDSLCLAPNNRPSYSHIALHPVGELLSPPEDVAQVSRSEQFSTTEGPGERLLRLNLSWHANQRRRVGPEQVGQIELRPAVDQTGERNAKSQIAIGVSGRRAPRTSACARNLDATEEHNGTHHLSTRTVAYYPFPIHALAPSRPVSITGIARVDQFLGRTQPGLQRAGDV